MTLRHALGALALTLAAATQTVDAQGARGVVHPPPPIDERLEIWNALFTTPMTYDSGFFFFDQVITAPGPYSGHNGWNETFTLEAFYVENFTPQDAVDSGYFSPPELAYILSTDLHYTLITGELETTIGKASIALTIFSGFITIDPNQWVSFGWTALGTVINEPQGLEGDCGNWSGPDTWPLPPDGESWCNDWYTVPCPDQDPEDRQDYVDLDCFDAALEAWEQNLDDIKDTHQGAIETAAYELDVCRFIAGVNRDMCLDAADSSYEDCVSGITPAQWTTGVGALLIGSLAGPVGGIMIGGTALVFEAILDAEKEECIRDHAAAQMQCELDFDDANDTCDDEYEDALCQADDDAQAASDQNDQDFLDALEDCCNNCPPVQQEEGERIPD